MKVDVIIPVYKPGKRFSELLFRLSAQERTPDQIIVVNTGKEYWDAFAAGEGKKAIPENLSVYHVTPQEFDHGATRDMGLKKSDADVCIFMTDDALPADRHLITRLCGALGITRADDACPDAGTRHGEMAAGADGEDVRNERTVRIAAAYARQLPDPGCRVIERYTREFNYPAKSMVKTIDDLPRLGIKTYFCSNVCAAYPRKLYLELGGFTKKTIFNEDMIFAAHAMKEGYAVAYAADARVIHSHNYSCLEQFHRNFDLAVSQADHPEVFEGVPSEGEGIRLVKKTAAYLLKSGHALMIPYLIAGSGCKYAGYLLGKRYRRLPLWLVKRCSMNRNYWKG